MIAAFSGWNDAADSASDAVRWLVRASAARPFAALDIEEYLDFQAARPTVELVDGVVRTVNWPSLALSARKQCSQRRNGLANCGLPAARAACGAHDLRINGRLRLL